MKTLKVTLLGLALCGILLCACATSGSTGRERSTVKGMEEKDVRPAVRQVPNADLSMLWRAAHDYIERFFPLDVDDPRRRVVETKTLEWEANRLAYRTRITVEVARDPARPRDAKLGVIARLMQPSYILQHVRTGEPIPTRWRLVGYHPEMQEYVASKIMERYLLLRQGRNPDEGKLQSPIDRFSRSGK